MTEIIEHQESVEYSRYLRRLSGREVQNAADHMILLDERLRFERQRNEGLERRIDDFERRLDDEPVCV